LNDFEDDIGANITIFSIINAVLVRPLAAPQAEKLVRLYETNERPLAKESVSAPNFLDWRERTRGFESMGAYVPRNFALQGRSGSVRVLGVAVSANYVRVIGVEPRWGRSFGRDEDQPGRDHVVIISEVLCRRLYGDQTEVLGRSVQLNSETYTIVGIASAGFCFPDVHESSAFAYRSAELRSKPLLTSVQILLCLLLLGASLRSQLQNETLLLILRRAP
jgi:putative ABC transport system permease protein